VRFAPPLIITAEQVTEAGERIKKVGLPPVRSNMHTSSVPELSNFATTEAFHQSKIPNPKSVFLKKYRKMRRKFDEIKLEIRCGVAAMPLCFVAKCHIGLPHDLQRRVFGSYTFIYNNRFNSYPY